MNYLYYFIQACLVVLIIYTIPKLWAMSFTLPSLSSIPKLPSLPQGITKPLEPYQQILIFLFVAFFTITIVEKWLRHFFVSYDSEEEETDDGIRLTSKIGTFGTMLMKNRN